MKQFCILVLAASMAFLGGCDKAKEMTGISDSDEATADEYSVQVGQTYVFSAPPRESLEDGMKQYGAIADYLSKTTGKKIKYVHQTNWLSYLQDMKVGKYDIAFDGPHFNAWRNRYLNHEPVARIDFPCNEVDGSNCKVFKPKWHMVYRKGTDISRLSGRTFCLHSPPNFGTLSLLHTKFPDPTHQPYIKEMKGWVKMVKAVRDNENECEFTVSRGKHLRKVDPNGEFLASETFDAFVNQGFTVNKALPAEMRMQIKQALLSDEGSRMTAAFHKRFISAKHRLVAYGDTPDYDKPFDILAQQYLIPWALFKYPVVASAE